MTRTVLLMSYIMCIWFVISFVTNLIGPLMPIIIKDFDLSLALAGLLPFSFFIAYGVISVPAGALVEARGPRATLLLAYALNLAGSAAIAFMPSYVVVIAGLFIIGTGMAMLQVVINPLMRATGGDRHFAFFSVLGQLVFGAASFVSPLVFEQMMNDPAAAATPLAWVHFYRAFTVLFLVLIVVSFRLPIRSFHLDEAERPGTLAAYKSLLARRDVWLFFLGIVAYVGTEQSLANWMSQFLATYDGLDPTREGAQAVSRFWGLMSVGCLLGLLLLRLWDSRTVLGIFTVAAFVCLALALWGGPATALAAFPACGFCLSVMFSIVFSLGLNSVAEHHGAFSGILCTGILGGAIVPLWVGVLGDWFGLRVAMLTVFVTLAYILGTAVWARPLVRNATVPWRELFKTNAAPPSTADGA